MPIFKMPHCLPQSAPGNIEYHFGYKCDVRADGIYIDLTDEATIANFKAVGRIGNPVVEVKVAEPEVVVEQVVKVAEGDENQTMTDVIENGSGKRVGRPKKAE